MGSPLKEELKKATTGMVESKLTCFLFHYRNTPHSNTGVIPSELLMGRRLRSHLGLLKPDVSSRVAHKQQIHKAGNDKLARERPLNVGDAVYACNFSRGTTWLAGAIVSRNGPLSFEVELVDGRILRRHMDHI